MRSDRIVQLDADCVQADGLDRLGDFNRAFVDQRPAGFLDGGRDVAAVTAPNSLPVSPARAGRSIVRPSSCSRTSWA